jgi:CHAT domain-containing protein
MGSERYLLTEDNKSLRDIAAHVPYDALLIMINHKRYGGGGIYNSFLTFTSDNQWKDYVFVHEFGHSFAGLADEYYTSSTAYSEFYPQGIEPTEPNITALLDKKNVKWKSFLSKKIEVPTPWEKADFDSMDVKYQKIRTEVNDKVARLKRDRAPQEEIQAAEAESEELSLVHAKQMDKYLQNSKFFGKVGVFEGAGYSSKGLYRPMIDCIMFTKGEKPFCKVCENAIIQVIKHYSE